MKAFFKILIVSISLFGLLISCGVDEQVGTVHLITEQPHFINHEECNGCTFHDDMDDGNTSFSFYTTNYTSVVEVGTELQVTMNTSGWDPFFYNFNDGFSAFPMDLRDRPNILIKAKISGATSGEMRVMLFDVNGHETNDNTFLVTHQDVTNEFKVFSTPFKLPPDFDYFTNGDKGLGGVSSTTTCTGGPCSVNESSIAGVIIQMTGPGGSNFSGTLHIDWIRVGYPGCSIDPCPQPTDLRLAGSVIGVGVPKLKEHGFKLERFDPSFLDTTIYLGYRDVFGDYESIVSNLPDGEWQISTFAELQDASRSMIYGDTSFFTIFR